MILDDDTEPKNKKQALRPLDKMSVTELHEYVGDLQAEIVRVEAEMIRKEKHLNAAAALFGKPAE